MERLYRAADELKGIKTQTGVAIALNVSPQVVKNWEDRGISKQGLLLAQKIIGCSAHWLQTGEGSMLREDSPSLVLDNDESINRVIELITLFKNSSEEGKDIILATAKSAAMNHQKNNHQ